MADWCNDTVVSANATAKVISANATAKVVSANATAKVVSANATAKVGQVWQTSCFAVSFAEYRWHQILLHNWFREGAGIILQANAPYREWWVQLNIIYTGLVLRDLIYSQSQNPSFPGKQLNNLNLPRNFFTW